MTAWYEDTFGRDYLALYPHRNEDEARRDIAALLQLIPLPRTEPLLDLCCGAGRHLVALSNEGFTNLTGLDLSADLLAEARLRLDAQSKQDVTLLKADMRCVPRENYYRTILSLFTSFGYFADQQEDERVLQSAFCALVHDGTFVLDTLNREYILDTLVRSEVKTRDDLCLQIHRGFSADGRRVEKETRVTQAGSPETIYRESVRMYTKGEMEDMLSHAGFVNHRFFGSLRGEPFSISSPRTVVITSKAVS